MSRAHVAAVLALAATDPALTTYDDVSAKDAVPPYAVIRTDSGVRGRTSIKATSDAITMIVTVTSVGVDRYQAQAIAERGLAVLLDARPAVAGRTCSPIEHLTSRPTELDHDFTPPLHYSVDLYQFMSVPG